MLHRISHEWLMADVPMCKTILQKWLKAGIMEKHVFYATEEGTPRVAFLHQCWRTWRWTAWNGSCGDATRKHRP